MLEILGFFCGCLGGLNQDLLYVFHGLLYILFFLALFSVMVIAVEAKDTGALKY